MIELNGRTARCYRCDNPTNARFCWAYYEDFIIGAGQPWQERGGYVPVCGCCYMELLNEDAQA